MDHVLDLLEREENSFCNIGDTFVEVAFLLQKCVAVISSCRQVQEESGSIRI